MTDNITCILTGRDAFSNYISDSSAYAMTVSGSVVSIASIPFNTSMWNVTFYSTHTLDVIVTFNAVGPSSATSSCILKNVAAGPIVADNSVFNCAVQQIAAGQLINSCYVVGHDAFGFQTGSNADSHNFQLSSPYLLKSKFTFNGTAFVLSFSLSHSSTVQVWYDSAPIQPQLFIPVTPGSLNASTSSVLCPVAPITANSTFSCTVAVYDSWNNPLIDPFAVVIAISIDGVNVTANSINFETGKYQPFLSGVTKVCASFQFGLLWLTLRIDRWGFI